MTKFTGVIMLKDYLDAPDSAGIYEIGFWVEPEYFVPRYIGRARGRLDRKEGLKGTTIRSRLSCHYRQVGNKGVARGVGGDFDSHVLLDPDIEPTEVGRQKMMQVHKELWCRWMETYSAADYESNFLRLHEIGEGSQYVWNRRREHRKP